MFKLTFKAVIIWLLVIVALAVPVSVFAAEESGPIGITGKISSPPPSTGATITFPESGAVFTELPITVTGLCPGDVLVKLFKNEVFAGSAQCQGGNFSITTDLFNGQNTLVARVYDSLDQQGPDSNIVVVTFNPTQIGSRPVLTSALAKKGVNPGDTLVWPIILTGGTGPYAISVDWGDDKQGDLFSLSVPGQFDISHIYDSPGIYTLLIKATDKNGLSAYLQLTAIANGPLSQSQGDGGERVITIIRIIWEPLVLLTLLVLLSFWLGKKHELRLLSRKK